MDSLPFWLRRSGSHTKSLVLPPQHQRAHTRGRGYWAGMGKERPTTTGNVQLAVAKLHRREVLQLCTIQTWAAHGYQSRCLQPYPSSPFTWTLTPDQNPGRMAVGKEGGGADGRGKEDGGIYTCVQGNGWTGACRTRARTNKIMH